MTEREMATAESSRFPMWPTNMVETVLVPQLQMMVKAMGPPIFHSFAVSFHITDRASLKLVTGSQSGTAPPISSGASIWFPATGRHVYGPDQLPRERLEGKWPVWLGIGFGLVQRTDCMYKSVVATCSFRRSKTAFGGVKEYAHLCFD